MAIQSSQILPDLFRDYLRTVCLILMKFGTPFGLLGASFSKWVLQFTEIDTGFSFTDARPRGRTDEEIQGISYIGKPEIVREFYGDWKVREFQEKRDK